MLILHEYVKSFRHTRIQYMPFMLQEHALQRSRICPSCPLKTPFLMLDKALLASSL